MPYSITCSTKILTLAIAQFFLLVGILCEFAMVPGVYILEEVHSSYWGHRCTHSAVHSLKSLNLCPPLYYSAKVIAELKNTNNCFMVLIIRPGSTLKFHFVFDFNECLWAIFSLFKFWKFLDSYLGCGCMTFEFTTQMTLL